VVPVRARDLARPRVVAASCAENSRVATTAFHDVGSRREPGPLRRAVPLVFTVLFLALAAARADAPTATAGAQHSTAASPARASGGAPATLRFVTFNAYHGGFQSGWTGDARHIDERLAIAAEQLRALAPDVVALQEASAGRARGDIAAKLAGALGFQHVRAAASVRAVPIPLLNELAAWVLDFDEGPAILSRYPIAAAETYELPRCGAYLDPRVVLRAEIATPHGRVQAFSTHTSNLACQVERAARIVRAWRGAMPAVLMGDLNGVETMPWIAALGEAGLIDAFRAVNLGEPGVTTWQRVDGPVSTARRRIDYIFVLPGTAAPGAVRESRVVVDRPGRRADGTPLWASDHYGVLAEISLAPAAAETASPGSAHDARRALRQVRAVAAGPGPFHDGLSGSSPSMGSGPRSSRAD
jgi:endonuclease/exonuclease/phosphatase family metal-dependent hydrolase